MSKFHAFEFYISLELLTIFRGRARRRVSAPPKFAEEDVGVENEQEATDGATDGRTRDVSRSLQR